MRDGVTGQDRRVRYLALACDYDGTLATDGRVDERTSDALERVRASGRRLVLVSGRELPDLDRVFPRLDLFDLAVLENGALLHDPRTRTDTVLAESPPAELVAALHERGVTPLSVGRAIVATREPHAATAVEVIRDLGLEHSVVFNKGAVMLLPAGVTKATGLRAALRELGLSPRNVVGVGDAENDHAFLADCECAVAVANALPALRRRADHVTAAARGGGVVELAERLLADDLADLEPALTRHHVLLGHRAGDGAEVRLAPYGESVLVAGPSGSGKSTLTTGLLERLSEHGYQFCLVDPEGDYEEFAEAVPLGDPRRPPDAEEVVQFLADPGARSATVNLVGVPLPDRPGYLRALLPHLVELRARTGRPHWIAVDEAHHLLPAEGGTADDVLPRELGALLMVTVHPERVSRAAVAGVGTFVAIGAGAAETLRAAAEPGGRPAPVVPSEPADAVVWRPPDPPLAVRVAPARAELRRHLRKYAEGDLGDERSFRFRGPEGHLDLRARNLHQFLDLADGVDDDTWTHHLHAGDVARWFADCIKDEQLAAEAERIAGDAPHDPRASRARVREAVERRYTLPA